jgi:DNA-binding transcriptional ArsR family regulator
VNRAVFDALGDPTRRDILETLGPTEQAAGMIVAALQARRPISQPAVSQHLKSLHDACLVTFRSEGTKRIYAIDHAALDAAHAWLTHLVDPLGALAQPLDALATEIARGKRTRARRTQSTDAIAETGSGRRRHA